VLLRYLPGEDAPEADLQQWKRLCAAAVGALYYHVSDSRGSAAGFPDDIVLTETGMVIAENKVSGRRMTPEQRLWIERFVSAREMIVFVNAVTRENATDWLDALFTISGHHTHASTPPPSGAVFRRIAPVQWEELGQEDLL
jgi:hypothetical protein